MRDVSRREKANAIRALSMDAVQRAKSGHPGAPMGMADIAEVLWSDYHRHNPSNPGWADRDRFVLSNGHGSMLLYSLLHLSGYDLPMEELRNFRQLHSRTPGHPEYGETPGVETTTGPLGQGLANAVGMAVAERTLGAQFNRPGHEIIDHRTWVFLGDGCLMEGISHEACSLAGTLGLGKLIAFYDDNGISIDGEVEGWFTDDTVRRFEAYGWQVIPEVDGHDPDAVRQAIDTALADAERPSLLCCRTVIGYGAPNKQGGKECHGAPLGDDEVAAARVELGWEHPPFSVPGDIAQAWDARTRGGQLESAWRAGMEAYAAAYPALAAELDRRLGRGMPANWVADSERIIEQIGGKAESIASRKASLNALNAFGPLLPELIGGSADLAGSNYSIWAGSRDIHQSADGNYIYFGVREFGMSAMVNGIVLHGGFRGYGATFLIFSEYARNALRMATLMRIPSIFLFTHDSIGVGEDGPTHQPIEQAGTLRMIPGMAVWRPCDTVESAVAWQQAMQSTDQPFSLIFSRQNLQHQDRSRAQIAAIARGGYVLRDCDGEPEAIVIATGSEVGIAVDAALALSHRRIRVVSMPSTDRFDSQDPDYRESVLPSGVRLRVAVEAGVTDGWWRYVGSDGAVIGIDTFGASGPAADVFAHFDLTADRVRSALERLLGIG